SSLHYSHPHRTLHSFPTRRSSDLHFKSQHYKVSSHESDNLGWDLSAILPEMGIELKLEVKGLSGPDIAVELTPNEYTMMKKHKQDRKSTRLNSSHVSISYAVFCLK